MNTEHPLTNNTMTRSSSNIFCVRYVTLTVVTIFVVFMAIIGIAWLVMDPHDPGFRVTSLSVSNFTVSDNSQVGGKYEVNLTITNPNEKIQVMVDRFNVLVLYGKVVLSVGVVQEPLFVEKMRNKSVKVELVVSDSPKKVVPENLVKDWNKKVVNFNVKFVMRVRFEAGVWPSREKFMHVNCGDLDVAFFSAKDSGKLLGPQGETVVESVLWTPPPLNSIKVNMDGSFNPESRHMGVSGIYGDTITVSADR
ncbi:Late embryogenesis abundant protein [Sesbania bispinosa]|nr:Late embryogenesis abundant protein [Sesbania bispinosa]